MRLAILRPAICKNNFARWLGAVLVLALLAAVSQRASVGQTVPGTRILARGTGITMLEGGSGAPDYMPVFTKIAFQ